MMLTRKDAPAQEEIELRVCIPAGDEHSLTRAAVLVPQDSHAMGRVFAANTDDFRHQLWADMIQANHTDSGDSKSVMKLRSEARRKLLLHRMRINPKVSKDAPADGALYDRQFHLGLVSFGPREGIVWTFATQQLGSFSASCSLYLRPAVRLAPCFFSFASESTSP